MTPHLLPEGTELAKPAQVELKTPRETSEEQPAPLPAKCAGRENSGMQTGVFRL